MAAFFAEFVSYIVKMIFLVALGACGGFIGFKLRKNKTAKEPEEK